MGGYSIIFCGPFRHIAAGIKHAMSARQNMLDPLTDGRGIGCDGRNQSAIAFGWLLEAVIWYSIDTWD